MAIKSEALFTQMTPMLEKSGADICKKVQAVFLFEIRAEKGSTPHYFTVDLKNGSGKISKGKEGKVDTTFIMFDEDILKMADGKLNPQNAFMTGKMKIKGNMAKAMKFTPDLLPKDAGLPKL